MARISAIWSTPANVHFSPFATGRPNVRFAPKADIAFSGIAEPASGKLPPGLLVILEADLHASADVMLGASIHADIGAIIDEPRHRSRAGQGG